jgi:hypothetical protein
MNKSYELNSRCKHYCEELRYNGASDPADGVEATNVVVAGRALGTLHGSLTSWGVVELCGSTNSTLSR